jgi:4-amino-4-deoxy-L-arabinose transferase-like glycosyltransferase
VSIGSWRSLQRSRPSRWLQSRFRAHGIAVAIGLVTALWAIHNNDFPLGFHFDEVVKVKLLAGAANDYLHPPLLIVLAKTVAFITGASTEGELLMAGRTVSALAAIMSAVLFYSSLRFYAPQGIAAVWSLAFSLSPAIAVHAHYFKEDVLLVLAICMSLHALLHLRERRNLQRLLYLGLALGLAPAAKYVGVFNSAAVLVLAIATCRLRARELLIIAATALATIVLIFLLSVQTSLSNAMSALAKGLSFEIEHAKGGHDLKEWSEAGYGGTHLWHHLLPSVTLPVLLIASGAIALVLARSRSREVATYAGLAGMWLFLIELSPLKLIGQMRYVLPVVVYLLFAGAIACARLREAGFGRPATVLSLAAAVVSAHSGFAYVRNLAPQEDTRASALAFVSANAAAKAVTDYPIGYPVRLAWDYAQIGDADFLISLRFARFLRGSELREQRQSVYLAGSMFRCLEGHVAAVFSRLYGDYGFVAPTVKVYDLRRARS